MAEENAPQEPQEPTPSAQGQEPQEPKERDEPEVKDTHGQPGINKERHDKEVAALNARIEELQAKIDDSAKTEKAREELKAEVQKARDEIAAEKLTWKLEKAGCKNVKAAKAVLDDYEGDVAALKKDCPYLFEEEKKGATGLKPEGASKGSDADKVDRILGIKKKG